MLTFTIIYPPQQGGETKILLLSQYVTSCEVPNLIERKVVNNTSALTCGEC